MEEPVPLSFGDLARVVGGRVVGSSAASPIDGVSIDSRALGPGDLFVAIRGDRFDGHRFLDEAVSAGAIGALVSDESALESSLASVGVVVDDTLHALQVLSQHVRRASGARVVAITGSVGKTTTKELTAEVLGARYRVFRSHGNFNNHIGVPLSLLELRTRPEVAVIEFGMNASGEIRRLVEIAEPDLRVWTNVAEVHSEFFESIEAIADAKAEILEGATKETVTVANADDHRVMGRVVGVPGRLATFGVSADADVMATEVDDLGLDGTRAAVRTPDGSMSVTTPLLGRGNLANVLAAVTVALQLQISPTEAAARVAAVGAPPGRGQIHRLARGVLVVDDSYNANPLAVKTALRAVAGDRRLGRRVAVLGEMLELGRRADALHRDTGRVVAADGFGLLVTVGGACAKALGEAAVEAGLAADSVKHYDDSNAAATSLAGLLRNGDLVLVKGSRGVQIDRVVNQLVEEWA